MTIFRKLKEIEYISSYSHRGKYYSLFDIADFDHYALVLSIGLVFKIR